MTAVMSESDFYLLCYLTFPAVMAQRILESFSWLQTAALWMRSCFQVCIPMLLERGQSDWYKVLPRLDERANEKST